MPVDMSNELLGRIQNSEDEGADRNVRDELFPILIKTGSQNGWISACKSAVERNSKEWLSRYTNPEADQRPWFLERLHKREINPRDETTGDAELEPLFTRVSIAQSIANAALSALLLKRLSAETDDHQVPALSECIYRAVVQWQSKSIAKLSLNPDVSTLAEMRSCLRGDNANGYRTILTTLQVRHPEWEVVPVAELISYFLGARNDEWERMISVNVPLVRWDKTGFIARLDLEKRRSAVNAFYRDPFKVGFLQYDASFKKALDSGWSYVKTEFDVVGYEVRWRFAKSGQDIPNPVTGSSIGAGAAVALASLFADDRKLGYGSKWAITGTVKDDGSIGTVNGRGSILHDKYREKLEAVAGQHLKLIVPGEDWERVKDDLSSGPIRILRGASTVKEASYIIINEERSEKRRRFFKRAFFVSAAAAFLLFIFASAAAAYAWKERGNAEVARLEAEKQRDLAQRNESKAKENEKLADENARLAKRNEILAEKNAELAGQNELVANAQKKQAELQRHRAEIARNDAVQQRQIAEAQKQEAARQTVIASAQRQLALAREAELQGQSALARNDSSAAQLYFAKALALDYKSSTAARLLEAKAKTSIKLLWSSSDSLASRDISLSPDGRYVAAGGEDNEVLVLDAATGRTLQKLVGHEGRVISVKFNPKGQTLASGASDGTVRIWDIKSGKEINRLDLNLMVPDTQRGDVIVSIAFAPDGNLLAIGAHSERYRDVVWFWDSEKTPETAHLAVATEVRNLAISSKGTLAVSGSDNKVKFWNINNPNADPAVLDCYEPVETLAFSSNDQLAVGTASRILIWDVAANKEIRSLTGPIGEFLSLASSPDGPLLVSANQDKSVQIWNIETGDEISSINGVEKFPIAVAMGKGRFISASIDGPIRAWSFSEKADFRILTSQSGLIYRLLFSSDGKRLASTSQDGTVSIWDVENTNPIHTFRLSIPSPVAYSPDGKYLAIGSTDNGIMLVDANDGKKLGFLHGHVGEITALAFSADGKFLASGGDDKTVRTWSIAGLRELSVFRGNVNASTIVAFSVDGRLVASGCMDNAIRIWDVATQKLLHTLNHPGQPWSIAFSPDGVSIASSCSGDSVLRVWDLKSGKETLEFIHSAEVGRPTGLAFSQDGSKLIWAGGAERKVRIWDLQSGVEMPPLLGAETGLVAIAMSPDGSWLASAGIDSQIYLWRMKKLEHNYDDTPQDSLAKAKGETGLDMVGPEISVFSPDQLDQILGFQRNGSFTLVGGDEAPEIGFWKMLNVTDPNKNDGVRAICPNAPTSPTLNAFPIGYDFIKPCTDFPTLDVSKADGIFAQNKAEWDKERIAKAGDEISVRIYLSNGVVAQNDENAAAVAARQIEIKTSLDGTAGESHLISVALAGSNTNTLNQTLRIKTGPHDHLELVPRSGIVYDAQNVLRNSNFEIGNGTVIVPELQPGPGNSLWLYYTVKVSATTPPPLPAKTSVVLDLRSAMTSLLTECQHAPQTAVLNPYPLNFTNLPSACTDPPPLSLSIIGRPNKLSNESEWNRGIDAKTGDEIFVRLYVRNGASTLYPFVQTLAKNVRIQTFVDTPAGPDHIIRVAFAGANTNLVTKSLHVRTSPTDALEIVPNSGEASDGDYPLAKNFQLGNNTFRLGDFAPGAGSKLYLVFKVRVVSRSK